MNLAPEVISAESQSKEGVFRLGNYKMQSGKFLQDAFYLIDAKRRAKGYQTRFRPFGRISWV